MSGIVAMPVDIDISSYADGQGEAILHLLPCKIEHNGDADVASYFTTGIRPDEDDTQGQGRGI